MTKCPACGTPLEVQLSPTTDYSKSKEELDRLSSEDPYLNLSFWKPSQKKSNLATIAVTTEVLVNPAAKDLYEKLKIAKTLKILKTTYRLSEYQDHEYLQKWLPVE